VLGDLGVPGEAECVVETVQVGVRGVVEFLRLLELPIFQGGAPTISTYPVLHPRFAPLARMLCFLPVVGVAVRQPGECRNCALHWCVHVFHRGERKAPTQHAPLWSELACDLSQVR
jgi:hypothetical protein